MNHNNGEQLDWQAFLYIAGELSKAEQVEFESRLADDPLACEAVSRQVQWTSAAALAFEPAVSRQAATDRNAQRGGIIWRLSLGVAACLAVAASVYFLNGRTGPNSADPVAESAAAATEQLATAWSQTVENWPLADDTVAAMAETDMAPAAEGITEVATPDWMRIAIEGLVEDGIELPKEM